MVTAGVYLIARSEPIVEFDPTAVNIAAFIGSGAAVIAASIALVATTT